MLMVYYSFYDSQIPFNNITSLTTPPEGILQNVKSLDLEGNSINDWREINKLGTLRW
jgi:Leucine-rich repeat (LRR) protein